MLLPANSAVTLQAVSKMNALAAELGALDTRTATPSGLDGPGMSSSPYDLAVIFHTALQNPTFAGLIHTETVEFPGFPKDPTIPDDQDRPGFTLANDNQAALQLRRRIGRQDRLHRRRPPHVCGWRGA